MKKLILIPNATSPRNIGDQAMLESLLKLLQKSYSGASITVHSTDPSLYPKNKQYVVRHTLYSWAVFSNTRFIERCIKIVQLAIAYALTKRRVNSNALILDHELHALIKDYVNADLIVFVGGGYLRSKAGIKQSLNLLMQLVIFAFASRAGAKTIVAPISFGPFGYPWQEKLVAWILRRVNLVSARESISYSLMKKHDIKNLILSCDHALLIGSISHSYNNRSRRPIVGFTIRNWEGAKKQQAVVKAYIQALSAFSRKTNAIIQPIVQVNAPMYGENDAFLTGSISRNLRLLGIEVLQTKSIRSVDDGLTQYGGLDLLLGMRMHSNILAATQGTPFVAISYEHKTEGISRQIDMKKYCIKCEQVDKDTLYNLLIEVYKKRNYLKNKLLHSIEAIQIQETRKWNYLLSKY